jgi:hypothetical protein
MMDFFTMNLLVRERRAIPVMATGFRSVTEIPGGRRPADSDDTREGREAGQPVTQREDATKRPPAIVIGRGP